MWLRPFVLWLLLAFSSPLIALTQDNLSSLPQRWAGKLQPVPVRDLSGANTPARHAIEETRQKLGQLLLDENADSRELAAAYGKLAALYQVYAMPALAEVAYANALSLDPQNFRWRYLSARLADETGKASSALEQYRQARSLRPDYPAFDNRIGKVLLDLDRLDEARRHFRKALEKDGQRAMAHFYLGQIALMQRRFPEAVDHFRKTLALDPEASATHFPLAQALRGTGNNEQAREQARLAGKRLPQPDDPEVAELVRLKIGARPVFRQALDAVRKRDYAQARRKFEEGLKLDPENLDALVSYARVLYLDGLPEKSEQTLRRVLKRNPSHANANFFLALLLDRKTGDETARRFFEKALKTNPYHAGAHFFLANLLLRSGRYADAEKHYEKAISLDSRLTPAKFFRIVARYLSGEPLGDIRDRLSTLAQSGYNPQLVEYALMRFEQGLDDGLKNDPWLVPPPANPFPPMRDYPSSRPY